MSEMMGMDAEQLREFFPEIRPLFDCEQMVYDMLTELYAGNPNVHIMIETNMDTSAVLYDSQQILIMYSCGAPKSATKNLTANRWRFFVDFTVITLDADMTYAVCADLSEKLAMFTYTQSGASTVGRVQLVHQASFMRQSASTQMNGKALKERTGTVVIEACDFVGKTIHENTALPER